LKPIVISANITPVESQRLKPEQVRIKLAIAPSTSPKSCGGGMCRQAEATAPGRPCGDVWTPRPDPAAANDPRRALPRDDLPSEDHIGLHFCRLGERSPPRAADASLRRRRAPHRSSAGTTRMSGSRRWPRSRYPRSAHAWVYMFPFSRTNSRP
jgi:hypothetical protein